MICLSLRSSGTSLAKSIDHVSSPESWLGFPAQKDITILYFSKSWTANYFQRCKCIQWAGPSWSFAQPETVSQAIFFNPSKTLYKGTFETADQLKKDYLEAESKRQKLPWSKPPQ
jgi:hypothetical protein